MIDVDNRRVKGFIGQMIVLLMLVTMIFNLHPITPVRAQLPIEITEDYTFTKDLEVPLIVAADNLEIDGAGYTLEGSLGFIGISLMSRKDITISNLTIKNCQKGIFLDSSSNIRIYNVTLEHNGWFSTVDSGGIGLNNSNNNQIFGNTFQLANNVGILLKNSSNNEIYDNNWGAGINEAGISIELTDSSNNTITNNYVQETGGFHLLSSSNNHITDNTMDHKGFDIRFESHNNTIARNQLIHGNIKFNFGSPKDNIIYHNSFINGIEIAATHPTDNYWYHPDLLEGNYWDNYPGVDDGSGTDKHAIAGDGIGDTDLPWPDSDYDIYPLIRENPTADFNWTPSAPTIEETIKFTDASTDTDGTISAWNWDFGDEIISTEQNPTHSYNDSGTYQITLTVTDNHGLEDSYILSLEIQPKTPETSTSETTTSITTVPEFSFYLSLLVTLVLILWRNPRRG